MLRRESRGFALTAASGQSGEALKDVREEPLRLDPARVERVLGIALGLFRLTLPRSERERARSARTASNKPFIADTASSAQRRAAARSPPASAASAPQ